MKILAKGGVTVYPPRGSYQFNVLQIVPAGEGALRLKIEQLKKKLQSEGLFSQEHKKPVPVLPLTLGVATAPTGAAIQDIIRVARSRFENINILLAPCLVQGDDAPSSIVEAIEALNDPLFEVDVIIAGRGGGSFEDLIAFNDEAVVRAYFNSRVPIVSAVGHEIDHPISDLAADAYAATPSAAVEMIVPVYDDYEHRLSHYLKNLIRREKERLIRILKSRVHLQPASFLDIPRQSLDIISKDLQKGMTNVIRNAREKFNAFQMLPILYRNRVFEFQKRFSIAEERLQNFSPLATLKRGYSVVREPSSKKVIRSSKDVHIGQPLEVLLSQGKIAVTVNEVGDT
jgi:exodeoxyribonuclease VII large subunit